LSVEDDGAGIAPEHRERIFERFVRLDEARARDDGGSGLGLAIVAAIVHAHGGSVRVTDGRSGGARFEVTLPMSAGDS
jgi:signal transduction histidine kinase